MPTILGCMEKLKCAYHDVSETEKFPEFVQHVYMESIGTGPFGDPMLQPKK
jgi:hypothetical protein